eukprot:COSAG01_NODE_1307_length_10805_cov_22.707547_2_plen_142_part_00
MTRSIYLAHAQTWIVVMWCIACAGTVGVHDVSSCVESLSRWPGWDVSIDTLLASAECIGAKPQTQQQQQQLDCQLGRVPPVGAPPFVDAVCALSALLQDGNESMGITAAQLVRDRVLLCTQRSSERHVQVRGMCMPFLLCP